MKKLIYMGMGLLLCLSATLFVGCEDKPLDETGGGSGGTEQRGGVEGVVTDKGTGDAIAQAVVELVPGGMKTQTDRLGAFSLTDVKVGSYTLQVSKSGYVDYRGNVVVAADRTVYTTVEMDEEQTDLQVLDTLLNTLHVLSFDGRTARGTFLLKNTGGSIVEWEIPKLAEDWIAFSNRSGKLAPGASERIELAINAVLPLLGSDEEATVYIGSTAGDKQLRVRVASSMVYVQGGTFEMGATEEQLEEEGAEEWALQGAFPIHSVTLDGFYIGKYEVTQAQWKAVMGTTLEQQRDKAEEYWNRTFGLYGVGDAYPMYYVNWEEAQAFCEKLSQMTGKMYRLPTEAEWEYAARGGQHHDGTKYAGSDVFNDVAVARPADETRKVGTLKPNGLGLYDMSGNVSEWCSDWYGPYSAEAVVNPQGPSSGSGRVRRGGSWYYHYESCRVARRTFSTPDSRYEDYGFRVVCEAVSDGGGPVVAPSIP